MRCLATLPPLAFVLGRAIGARLALHTIQALQRQRTSDGSRSRSLVTCA